MFPVVSFPHVNANLVSVRIGNNGYATCRTIERPHLESNSVIPDMLDGFPEVLHFQYQTCAWEFRWFAITPGRRHGQGVRSDPVFEKSPVSL